MQLFLLIRWSVNCVFSSFANAFFCVFVIAYDLSSLRLFHCKVSIFHLNICLQVVGNAALACGMIAVGTMNGEVTSTILQTMMERSDAELKETFGRYLALGLALAFLG